MRRCLPSALILVAFSFGCSAQNQQQPVDAELQRESAGKPVGRKLALLVGCTKYDKLPEHFWLRGPGNDVVLMRKLLIERFGFAEKDIVTLAEGPKAADRPTRANIKSQFDRLAKQAGPGDQIIIVMGGHGSQQPDQEPFDEPDGLDETFLPCDAGPWDGSKEAVLGAIIDDELQLWTKAITDRGAGLFLILDACHSGTMLRDPDAEEALREIPEGVLVPEEVLQKARKAAASRRDAARGGAGKPAGATAKKKTPGVVALYACQPHEPTVERSMPPGGLRRQGNPTDGARHGLLTYTVCEILTRSQSALTYRELAQLVHGQYIAWGRKGPTPLLEGADEDFEVLGMRRWPGRSQLSVSKSDDGWIVRAGLLHGLTENSILAVYPPAGAPHADTILSYARVRNSSPTEATIEPCAHAKLSAPKTLPEGGRCELAYVDYGSLRLRVGIEGAGKKDGEMHRAVRKLLAEIASASDSLVEPAPDGKGADVMVRVKEDKFLLVAADVAQFMGEPPPGAGYFGPYVLTQSETVREDLTRIARARNLLKLVSGATGDSHTDLDIEMVKLGDKTDRQGEKLKWGKQGLVLQPGEWVGWRITNRGKTTLDVTLLFIDSSYGIDAVFPRRGQAASGEGRFLPGQSHLIAPARINPRTLGLEHLLVIAVKGEKLPIDFTCLAQPSLARAEEAPRGGSKSVFASPLGRLLKNAVYAQGSSRGLDMVDADAPVLRLLSWTVASQAGKK